MQKLPLALIAMEAVILLLTASGCAVADRRSLLQVRQIERVSCSPQGIAKSSLNDLDELRGQAVQQSAVVTTSNVSAILSDPTNVLLMQSRRAAQVTPTSWDPDEGFQDVDYGVYVGGGSTIHNWPVAIGSTGIVAIPTPWLTARGGVMGGDDGGIGVGGFEGAIRLHAPTRLTPYVGLSTDLGVSGFHTGHVYRGRNVNTPQTYTSKLAGMAAIGPEVGLSYWLTSSTRINAGATYYVAAKQPDFVLLGVSMEFILPDGMGFISSGPVRRAAIDDDRDAEGEDPYFVDLKGLTDPMDIIRERVAKRTREDARNLDESTDSETERDTSSPFTNQLPPQLLPQSHLFGAESNSDDP